MEEGAGRGGPRPLLFRRLFPGEGREVWFTSASFRVIIGVQPCLAVVALAGDWKGLEAHIFIVQGRGFASGRCPQCEGVEMGNEGYFLTIEGLTVLGKRPAGSFTGLVLGKGYDPFLPGSRGTRLGDGEGTTFEPGDTGLVPLTEAFCMPPPGPSWWRRLLYQP